MRPLTYGDSSTILGHYAVAQRSGDLAAIGALGHLASVRWSSSSSKFVLTRLRAGISISGAVTAAVEFALRAIMVRGFTVDFTTASTAIGMTALAGTNKMRSNMSASAMGGNGPRIATTTVMSGQTFTADSAPFAMATLPLLTPTNSTGTAVALPVGAATPMVTLYEWTGLGQHPVTLGQDEGVVIQPVTAGPGSGTFNLHVEWSWAEVLANAI